MTEAVLLDALRTSSEIGRIFEKNFDFSPLKTGSASRLFHLAEDTDCELIARDKSGGEFALCQGKTLHRPLLYVSSEGQSGIIAHNLEEGISTIIIIPWWQDCLKFSGGGQLDEMRRVVPLSESDNLADLPRLESSRQILQAKLALPVLKDPVQLLHSAVTELSPLFPAYGSEGTQFSGLFNKFTVMSNPAWRRKLSQST